MREAAMFIANQSDHPTGALSVLLSSVARGFRAWRSRRKLLVLSELDDHILVDIGISRDDVRWALDLPFMHDPALELERRARRGREDRWGSAAI